MLASPAIRMSPWPCIHRLDLHMILYVLRRSCMLHLALTYQCCLQPQWQQERFRFAHRSAATLRVADIKALSVEYRNLAATVDALEQVY